MKLNRFLVAGILSLACISAQAQVKQQIGVHIGGGVSTLNYKGASTSFADRAGLSVEGTYTYFLNENWGLQTGLELSYHHSKADLNSFSGSVNAIDDEQQNFEYRYTVGGLIEKQNTYLINIPLKAHFETASNPTTNFFFFWRVENRFACI